MRSTQQAAFTRLIEWSQGNQETSPLHPSVEIYQDDLTSFSLRIKPGCSLDADDLTPIARCSLDKTLSYLNALIDGPITSDSPQKTAQPAFPPAFISSLPPHVIGRFFLVKEFLRGASSPWHPYIATLPTPDRPGAWALPAFWPAEDTAWLDGTNAEVAVAETQARVKDEFKQARRLLKAAGFDGWQDYSRVLYNWAFCVFTSRSFRPELVVTRRTREALAGLLPDGCDWDDFSILQPVFDLANHSPHSKPLWSCSPDPAVCHLMSQDTYTEGQQVFNNYGPKTNGELLLGYGFMLGRTEDYHNDYVHVVKKQAAETPGKETKPLDFLISLRPVNDPSSKVARQRQIVGDEFQIPPRFAHFQDVLVTDIAFSVITDSERATIQRRLAEQPGVQERELAAADQARVLLASLSQPGFEGLVARVADVLGKKLEYELAKLAEAEEGENEDGVSVALGEPANENQAMAAAYRASSRLTLEAAMRCLAGGEA